MAIKDWDFSSRINELEELRRRHSKNTLSLQVSSDTPVELLHHLYKSFVPIEVVREIFSEYPELLKELSDRYENIISDIYSPQAEDFNRNDLDENHLAWQEALDFAASQSLDEIRPLLALWEQRTGEAKMVPEVTNAEQLLERLRDSLAAVTAALEQSLPRRVRRDRSLLLAVCVFPHAIDQVSAQWMTDNWTGDKVPLFSLTRQRLGFVGGFKSNVADLIAQCVVQILSEQSSCLLPGFSFTHKRSTREADFFLKWNAPESVKVEMYVGSAGKSDGRKSDLK